MKDKDRSKGKGRRFCLGEEFIQFLVALAVLPRTILKNRINSSFSFKSSWCNSSYCSLFFFYGCRYLPQYTSKWSAAESASPESEDRRQQGAAGSREAADCQLGSRPTGGSQSKPDEHSTAAAHSGNKVILF